jgi:hypothetical protein
VQADVSDWFPLGGWRIVDGPFPSEREVFARCSSSTRRDTNALSLCGMMHVIGSVVQLPTLVMAGIDWSRASCENMGLLNPCS